MTERDFVKMLGRLSAGHDELDQFCNIVTNMMRLLDETDMDDYFGTEGWRYEFGWN